MRPIKFLKDKHWSIMQEFTMARREEIKLGVEEDFYISIPRRQIKKY